MAFGIGLTIVLTLVHRRRNGDGRLQPLGQGQEGLADRDVLRVSVRQSVRDARRRSHDGGARDAVRQPFGLDNMFGYMLTQQQPACCR